MATSSSNTQSISAPFGMHPSGKEILCYTLSSESGLELKVINYGATLVSLKVPTKNGAKIDVVLGFDNLSDYIKSYDLPSAPYIGALVGRYAGRINQAQFKLNNETISLTKNHNQHQLHGGFEGFSKAIWNVITVAANSITLEYCSKNGEENYPGEVITQVTYTLTDTMELKVAITAKTNQETPISLTQHSYFNLDGHQETIENQVLFVNSEAVLETTNENIPTGNLTSLKGHDFDFSIQKKCPTSIDNTFVLTHEDEVAASLYSSKNNIKMSVFTNQPGIHIYVGGNCFNELKGKENAVYNNLSGICFETQNYPDAPNHENFPNSILKKGATYIHYTTFKFEIFE
jgi:aldose 1-epimerase